MRARRPDLGRGDLRGNVNTRLAKLDAGEYDAIVLACAGLQRLGLADRIRQRLIAPAWLPAGAQGAIAIECRADDAQAQGLLEQLAALGFIKEAQYRGSSQNGIGYNFRAGLDYNVNKNMSVGGNVGYDTFGSYNESTAGLWLRYMLGEK